MIATTPVQTGHIALRRTSNSNRYTKMSRNRRKPLKTKLGSDFYALQNATFAEASEPGNGGVEVQEGLKTLPYSFCATVTPSRKGTITGYRVGFA